MDEFCFDREHAGRPGEWICRYHMTGKVGGIRIPALGNPNTAGILSVGRGAGDALWVTTFNRRVTCCIA